jgi:ABC-type nitrate/sulfonate/bicarbonate transport system substrate-binding protein
VIVDAPDTAYAFQLYEMLKRGGLNKGDYTIKPVGATAKRLVDIQQNKDDKASMLNPPFAFTAQNGGLKDQGSAVSTIGPYQATAGIVLRSWAKEHPDILIKYLQAYIEGLRYVLDPKNKDDATRMLADGLKLPPDVAAATYAVATDPVEGLAKDGRFDGAGFDNVLRLRADWTGRAPRPAATYVDLSYYEKALAGLG